VNDLFYIGPPETGPISGADSTAPPLTLGQIADAMNKFAAHSRPVLRELHCHTRVVSHLRAISVEAEPLPLGAIGGLAGIPVIEHDDMEPGAWEIRENGQAVASGKLRTYAEALAERMSELLPEGLRFEWQ